MRTTTNPNVRSIRLIQPYVTPDVYQLLLRAAQDGRDVYAYTHLMGDERLEVSRWNVWCIHERIPLDEITLDSVRSILEQNTH